MMKMKTLLIFALMFLTIGCTQQSREEIAEKIGRAKIKKIEKNVNARIEKMVKGMLKYPESYQPISTEMSIVTNNMILYDSDAFVALRDLNNTIEDFNKNYANDTTSQEARQELGAIQAMSEVVVGVANKIENRPVEFEAIDAYHQFYAEDRPGHQVKKGYHFVIHKDNRITLLCDHDEFLRIEAFTRELFNE
jgi:lysyl-tRNA synthetase class I